MEYLTKVVYEDGAEAQCLIQNVKTEQTAPGLVVHANVTLRHRVKGFHAVKKLVSGPDQFPPPFGPEYAIRVIETIVGIAVQCPVEFRRRVKPESGPEIWTFVEGVRDYDDEDEDDLGHVVARERLYHDAAPSSG